jgi:single-stranded-DNA-specific exonuclease
MDKIGALRVRLDAHARERLTPADFVPILEYDAEVSLDEVDQRFWESLEKLEPFGVGNPNPVFVARSVKLVQPPKLLKDKHIKLRAIGTANPPDGRRQRGHDVMGWRMAQRAAAETLLVGDVLDLAFTVDYNQHPEFGGVQLNLVDFVRPAGIVASTPSTP